MFVLFWLVCWLVGVFFPSFSHGVHSHEWHVLRCGSFRAWTCVRSVPTLCASAGSRTRPSSTGLEKCIASQAHRATRLRTSRRKQGREEGRRRGRRRRRRTTTTTTDHVSDWLLVCNAGKPTCPTLGARIGLRLLLRSLRRCLSCRRTTLPDCPAHTHTHSHTRQRHSLTHTHSHTHTPIHAPTHPQHTHQTPKVFLCVVLAPKIDCVFEVPNSKKQSGDCSNP